MGQLNRLGASWSATKHFPFLAGRLIWALARYCRAFTRRFGMSGWAILLLTVIGAVVATLMQQQVAEIGMLESRLAEQWYQRRALPAQPDVVSEDGRTRLQVFEKYLLPHEDIPSAVQELLRLAEIENLSISHAEYRVQPDSAGGFLRYRMTFPVKGEALAIRRFILSALQTQQTLALESIRFKRESISRSEIEAQIQWAMLTRLPSTSGGASGLQRRPDPGGPR